MHCVSSTRLHTTTPQAYFSLTVSARSSISKLETVLPGVVLRPRVGADMMCQRRLSPLQSSVKPSPPSKPQLFTSRCASSRSGLSFSRSNLRQAIPAKLPPLSVSFNLSHVHSTSRRTVNIWSPMQVCSATKPSGVARAYQLPVPAAPACTKQMF